MYDFYKTQPLDENFGTYNEGLGICPKMPRQGKPVYCTKDCALIGDDFHCAERRKNTAINPEDT